jgi:hypothetical protein
LAQNAENLYFDSLKSPYFENIFYLIYFPENANFKKGSAFVLFLNKIKMLDQNRFYMLKAD